MIRPRLGSFVYTHEEVMTMRRDIEAFRELGVAGLVFGALTAERRVDVPSCVELVSRLCIQKAKLTLSSKTVRVV